MNMEKKVVDRNVFHLFLLKETNKTLFTRAFVYILLSLIKKERKLGNFTVKWNCLKVYFQKILL